MYGVDFVENAFFEGVGLLASACICQQVRAYVSTRQHLVLWLVDSITIYYFAMEMWPFSWSKSVLVVDCEGQHLANDHFGSNGTFVVSSLNSLDVAVKIGILGSW